MKQFQWIHEAIQIQQSTQDKQLQHHARSNHATSEYAITNPRFVIYNHQIAAVESIHSLTPHNKATCYTLLTSVKSRRWHFVLRFDRSIVMIDSVGSSINSKNYAASLFRGMVNIKWDAFKIFYINLPYAAVLCFNLRTINFDDRRTSDSILKMPINKSKPKFRTFVHQFGLLQKLSKPFNPNKTVSHISM